MDVSITRRITEEELGAAVRDMTKGKAPGHDKYLVEFFQQLWPTISIDFYHMILRGMENENFHEGVTKGLISLIFNEGDVRDLNNWRPITLLPVIHNFLQRHYKQDFN